jgi:gas vesicle protein
LGPHIAIERRDYRTTSIKEPSMLRILLTSAIVAIALCGCSKNEDAEMNRFKDSAAKAVDSAQAAASHAGNVAKEAAQDAADQTKEAVGEVKEAAAKAGQKAKENTREAVNKAADKAKEAVK